VAANTGDGIVKKAEIKKTRGTRADNARNFVLEFVILHIVQLIVVLVK
jgi:hypothetical protein